MEDSARLAVLEGLVRDQEVFNITLTYIHDTINTILQNPHDPTRRTVNNITELLKIDGVINYLKYIGFEVDANNMVYPKEQSLNKLRMAQVAIARKLHFTAGPDFFRKINNDYSSLTPIHVLNTKNEFLLKIENLFNDVLKYEDKKLHRKALNMIPVVTLQMRAIDRMREHQEKIKSGAIQGQDMTFEMAQLIELTGWFKYRFFKWVDQPDCERCGDATTFCKYETVTTAVEKFQLEVYTCRSCDAITGFPRYNDPYALLTTRRGRCGEWANCFALFCRALGYDTRYVYDITDHVWCEVFDYSSNQWLHIDPCEGTLDAPLTYEHGWKKKLSYVIAVSRDDVQDVSWRYSSYHKELRKRRHLCTEVELINTILMLRSRRHEQLSESRRKYLAKRNLEELVQLMVERKPTEFENHGRISGAKTWRESRGEIGHNAGYEFEISCPGLYYLRYFTALDQYIVSGDTVELKTVNRWSAGAFEATNMFRKEETDWKMVYLAREEDTPVGRISWKLTSTTDDLILCDVSIRGRATLYEDGAVTWSLKFDDKQPVNVVIGEEVITLTDEFKDLIITAELSGGSGDVAWQHSQLFRQSMDDKNTTFEVLVMAKRVSK